MIGSTSDNEALVAARAAQRMLRASGPAGPDFIDPQPGAELATEAAAVLLTENAVLKAELEQLRRTGPAVALWNDVGAKVSDNRVAAQWALDLHRRGRVWLSADFEVPFLT